MLQNERITFKTTKHTSMVNKRETKRPLSLVSKSSNDVITFYLSQVLYHYVWITKESEIKKFKV